MDQPVTRRPTTRRKVLKTLSSLAVALPTRRVLLMTGCLTTQADAGVPDILAVEEVARGVFVARGTHGLMSATNGGHIANMTFIVGDRSVAIVDTGGSAKVGAALIAAIRKTTDRPIEIVINTHMHPDHVFGNGPFADLGCSFIGHGKLLRGLSARAPRYLAHNETALAEAFAGTRVVLPTRGVDAEATIDLGGRLLLLTAHPTAHTDNDLSVRDQATGTLILGDLLFSEHIPTIDGSIRGWLRELDRLAQQPADLVVPGHGPAALPWPDALKPEREYLETLMSRVKALIKAGRTLDDAMTAAAADSDEKWQLFSDYHRRNTAAAFAELEWD